jgi:flagellar biosynthesis/type III secretory pathway protein FliH
MGLEKKLAKAREEGRKEGYEEGYGVGFTDGQTYAFAEGVKVGCEIWEGMAKSTKGIGDVLMLRMLETAKKEATKWREEYERQINQGIYQPILGQKRSNRLTDIQSNIRRVPER